MNRCSRTQLAQGIMTVIDAMDAWKHESVLADFIVETNACPLAPPNPTPGHLSSKGREEDNATCQRTKEQVQKVETYLRRNEEETTQIQHLLDLLNGAGKINPALPIAG